jgi:hypothetical protein
MADEAQPKPGTSDVVLVHGTTDDGAGLRVLRARDGQVQAGEVRPLISGQPIHGDVIRMVPRGPESPLCDVETVFSASNGSTSAAEADTGGPTRAGDRANHQLTNSTSAPSGARTHKGPARVSSEAYRNHWDQLFGRTAGDSAAEPTEDADVRAVIPRSGKSLN